MEERKEFPCSYYPGTRDCCKTVTGKKQRKKCPVKINLLGLVKKLEKSAEKEKICEGRPVEKSIITRRVRKIIS